MDAIDILGSILGRRSSSKSSGGGILRDILGGGRQSQTQPQSQSHHGGGRPQGSVRGRASDSRSLEDLLGVAVEHNRRSREQYQPAPSQSRPDRRPPLYAPEQEELNEQAKILICAMVNATKADGKLDNDEQEAIYKHLDHVSQEELDFVRSQFKQDVDVRDFTWNVPIGMEEQVYAISLCSIDLDQNVEAKYLSELAHGLRLDPRTCNEIHRKYGAPEIFRS